MEILQILHMNKGEGESSYAKNSSVQKKILSAGYSTIREAMEELLWKNNFPESMGVADLGCSSGPNTLSVISEIIDIICKISCKMSRPMPELRISLNDLPGNDFNGVFLSLPEFYDKIKKEKGDYLDSCYVSGVPGTFYGRLFPRNSQHFVHSSSSIHWLSQAPPSLDSNTTHHLNKGKIYISKSSPNSVLNAYLGQFQNDFQIFLKSRSEEIIPGGRMVLSLMSRSSSDPTGEESCYHWELLARALMSMASEGLVEEEKIDSFNAPYYAPSFEEVKNEIEQEGSFTIISTEAFEVEWDACCPSSTTQPDNLLHWGIIGNNNMQSRGQKVAKTIRAVVEPMLVSHFGCHIIDEVFKRFRKLVDEYYVIKIRPYYINLVISLSKKVM